MRKLYKGENYTLKEHVIELKREIIGLLEEIEDLKKRLKYEATKVNRECAKLNKKLAKHAAREKLYIIAIMHLFILLITMIIF